MRLHKCSLHRDVNVSMQTGNAWKVENIILELPSLYGTNTSNVYYLILIYICILIIQYTHTHTHILFIFHLRGRDTIIWFTCKRYEKMLFLEIY